MTKKKPIKVVYNHKPDPIVSIKEYEYNSETGKPDILVKHTVYEPDKPQEGKVYALTGGHGQPSIAAGNTWAESLVEEIKQDPQCVGKEKK